MMAGNPLEEKHKERENRMILGWLAEEGFEKDAVEVRATGVLHQLAEEIYGQLLLEAVN